MIQITCTSCKRVLSIDDAFAGGVCRCQFCGTIQTVPARGSAQKAAAGAAKGPKTLFENKARGVTGVGSGSGLEDLADIVQSSSGLSDPNLRKPPAAPTPPPPKNLTPLLGISAAVILVLLIVVLVMAFHGSGASSAGTGPIPINNPSTPAPNAPPAAPSFCGVPIDHSRVVYLVDDGASSADVLDTIKTVMFKSINSLGPDRQFLVLFWNPNTETYPSDETSFAFAVKDNTDPLPGLKTALADNPGQIILVTAKAGDLDDSLIAKVAALRGNSTAHIDCIAVNGVPGDKVLAKIAAQSGGTFVPLPDSQLKAFSF
jgi:biopolymer transport protein ExbD